MRRDQKQTSRKQGRQARGEIETRGVEHAIPDPVLQPVAERKDRPATYLAHDKPRQGLEFPDSQRNGSSTGAIEEIAREEGKQQDRQ